MRLTELTPAQQATLREARRDWLNVARTTAPAPRARAEAALESVYESLGRPTPALVVWADSPLAGTLAALTRLAFTLDPSTPSTLGEHGPFLPPLEQIDAAIGASIAEPVRWEIVGAGPDPQHPELRVHLCLNDVYQQFVVSVTGPLANDTGARLQEQVRVGDRQRSVLLPDNVRAQVLAMSADLGVSSWEDILTRFDDQAFPPSHGKSPNEAVAKLDRARGRHALNWLHANGGPNGQHLAAQLGFYATLGKLGLSEAETLQGWYDLVRFSGGWWLFADFAILGERFTALFQDENGLLHNDNGPALAYRDGYALYAQHGSQVLRDSVISGTSVKASEWAVRDLNP